jgi:hypothetical protein
MLDSSVNAGHDNADLPKDLEMNKEPYAWFDSYE